MGRTPKGIVSAVSPEGGARAEVNDGSCRQEDDRNDVCVPASLLAGVRVQDKNAKLRSRYPEWGCFCPVVLPLEETASSALDREKNKQQRVPIRANRSPGRWPIDTPARHCVGKLSTEGGKQSQARAHTLSLSTALQDSVDNARTHSWRQRLSDAATAYDTYPPDLLQLTPRIQTGLECISALQQVVVGEGQVYNSCFREVVRQERTACKERGALVEVMRGHYASLFQDVMKHLEGLKHALQAIVSHEELLSKQVHHVQRLAKLLAQDTNSDGEFRRKTAAMSTTELERFIDTSFRVESEGGDKMGGKIVKGNVDVDISVGSNSKRKELQEKCDRRRNISSNENGMENDQDVHKKNGSKRRSAGSGKAPATGRESIESLSGCLSEVRSEPAAAAGNEADPSEAVRHVTAAIKIDMLQEMIDERIAVRKLKEERIRWKEWNSAATIKRWWRQVHPPDWEEGDRRYAVTLIQAHFRGIISRIRHRQAIEDFIRAEAAKVLQSLCRRSLAVRERKRRERAASVALKNGLRVLGEAVGDLEATVASFDGVNEEERPHRRPSRKQTSARKSTAGSASPGVPADIAKRTEPLHAIHSHGDDGRNGACDNGGAASGLATSATLDSISVSALVRRLKILGEELELREETRRSLSLSEDFGTSEDCHATSGRHTRHHVKGASVERGLVAASRGADGSGAALGRRCRRKNQPTGDEGSV